MSRQYKISGAIAEQKTINVDSAFFNWVASVTYFTDQYQTEGVPTAGTIEVLATIPGAGANASFNDSPIDATDPSSYASAGSPLSTITISPVGLAGVSYYTVTVTGTGG